MQDESAPAWCTPSYAVELRQPCNYLVMVDCEGAAIVVLPVSSSWSTAVGKRGIAWRGLQSGEAEGFSQSQLTALIDAIAKDGMSLSS